MKIHEAIKQVVQIYVFEHWLFLQSWIIGLWYGLSDRSDEIKDLIGHDKFHYKFNITKCSGNLIYVISPLYYNYHKLQLILLLNVSWAWLGIYDILLLDSYCVWNISLVCSILKLKTDEVKIVTSHHV